MLEELLFNLASPKIRTEMLEGKEHIVAPMVMLTEGVFDGSSGPLYYPASELAKTPAVWNHKPIVVYHPELNGQGISACDPIIMETRKVGIILNTSYSDKLRAEAWLDKERLAKVDQRVLEAIQKGKILEVSTGLFTDNEKFEGTWNGKSYSFVATNYRPDHLAILPDKKGACSIDDGAGLLANEQGDRTYSSRERRRLAKKGQAMKDGSFPILNENDLNNAVRSVGRAANPANAKRHIIKRAADIKREDLIPANWKLSNNAVSYSQIATKLRDLLASKYGTPGKSWGGYIEDIYPSQVIFSGANDMYDLYSQEYEVDDNGSITLKGTPSQVQRITSYQTKDGSPVKNEERKVTKQERVAALITANVGWTEAEKEFLLAMDDSKLAIIEKNSRPINNQVPAPVPTPVTPPVLTPVSTPTPTTNSQPTQTAEQYIASAPPEVREMLRNGLVAHNAEKLRLIGIITANAANRLTKEYLEQRSLEELSGIAALAAPPVQNQQVLQNQQRPLYLGSATLPPVTSQPTAEPGLTLPVTNWGK